MKRFGSRKSKYIFLIVAGFIICGVLAALAGMFFYKTSDHDMQGKIRYYLQRSAEKIKVYGHKKVMSLKGKIISTMPVPTDHRLADLSFQVWMDKPLRKINPLIYGSNLTPKTEFEMDVAKFGRDIGITNVRFPGGGSMGYHWKLSKYDFSDRFDQAPLSNIENVIKFCRIMNAQLAIQVNIESGTPEEAADWVRYMNKGIGNFRVDYWELGNEVYGDWDKAFMSGEDYAKLIKRYAAMMKQADPTIKIGADWGGERYQQFDEAILKRSADYIDFVSYHWYPNHINNSHRYQERNHPFPNEIMANALAVEKLVKRFEAMISELAPHRKGKIEFTIMEWDGSWDAVASDLEFEYKGMVWSLANAIFHADALGQFALHGVTVESIYCLQEIMHGLIRGWDKQAGWGGSRWDGETIRPKALVFKMFSRYFQDTLVESKVEGSPLYYKETDWRPDSYSGQVPYVTGYASKSSQGDIIAIALINKHAEKDFKVNIAIDGAIVGDQGEVWILNGPDLNAQNDGSPGVVAIKKYDLSDVRNRFSYNVPPHSVNMLRIPIKAKELSKDTITKIQDTNKIQ